MITTLFEAINFCGYKDIADNIFDYVNYFEYTPRDIDKDPYDFCLDWIAKHIEATSGDNDYIHCNISEFIDEHRYIFDEFCNQIYIEDYQPRNMDYIDIGDEEFYDYYLAMFSDIINGNFSSDEYELLARLIKESEVN